MVINTGKLGRVIGFLSLLCLPFSLTHAQTNATPAQIRPALKVLDSTKEQDGLVGSVRRVKTEIARIDIKDGRPVEGPRQLLEVTTYGVRGNRIDNVSYPVADSTVGREEYKYDDQGNIVEKILRDETGTVLSREAYEYVLDKTGNWTKMTASLVVIENGELKREPIEVTYRTLTYYAPENIPLTASATSAESVETTQTSRPTPERVEKPVDMRRGNPPPDSVRMATEIQIVLPDPASATLLDQQKTKSRARMVETPTVVAITPISATETPVEKPAEKEPTPQPISNGNGGLLSEVKATDSEVAAVADMPRQWAARKRSEIVNEDQPVAVAEQPVAAEPKANSQPVNSQPTPNSEPTAYVEGPPKASGAESTTAATDYATTMKAYEIYQLGRQKFEAGDIKGAADAYMESVRLEPKSAEFHLNLGHAYLSLKKDKEAIKAFREAVKFNPELSEAQYGLGFVLFRTGKFGDAMEAFKKAIALVPNMAKAHYGLALVYLEMDKLSDAVQQHRLLERLDSSLAAKLSQAFPNVDFSCRTTRFCR